MFDVDRQSYEPVYIQLKRQIIEKIESGEYNSGSKIPSVRELAKITGLACGTTAKAVNELVQESVVVKRAGIGNIVADRKCHLLGITGSFQERTFFKDNYYLGIMRGIHEVLEERHIAFIFRKTDNKIGNTFHRVEPDGIMVLGLNTILRFEKEIAMLAKKTKIVAVGGASYLSDINHVDSDAYDGVFRGMKMLIERGYKRITAFLPDRYERYRGYVSALESAGIKPDPNLMFFREEIEPDAAVERLMQIRPDATLSGSGSLTNVLLDKYLDKLPENTEKPALLTFDPHKEIINKYKLPNIIITQPLEEIGKTAAEKLIGLVEGRIKEAFQVNLETKLKVNL